MLHRRSFLLGMAGALTGATVLSAQEKTEEIDINETLMAIKKLLSGAPYECDAYERLEEVPAKGVVQWRWQHFRDDVDFRCLPDIERVNAELFEAMQGVLGGIANSGLQALMQEGMGEGNEAGWISVMRRIHREMIQKKFTYVVPFAMSRDIPPSPQKVTEELGRLETLRTPMHDVIYSWMGARRVTISPLGRLGAGYALHTQNDVDLFAAEDPVLDAKAAEAENSGDADEYEQCVMQARDRHFIEIIRASRFPIIHLLVGGDHNLTDDIFFHNCEHDDARMSHLIVTTKGYPRS